jgi:hypothetical protein
MLYFLFIDNAWYLECDVMRLNEHRHGENRMSFKNNLWIEQVTDIGGIQYYKIW